MILPIPRVGPHYMCVNVGQPSPYHNLTGIYGVPAGEILLIYDGSGELNRHHSDPRVAQVFDTGPCPSEDQLLYLMRCGEHDLYSDLACSGALVADTCRSISSCHHIRYGIKLNKVDAIHIICFRGCVGGQRFAMNLERSDTK